ncbi:polynucleotide 5'-hydroxyl-kinase NOL9 [Osmerus mordax]|uniref:polynucleotide 5'-hydroxyl-kinase NOL9 n=1 Tax=Osmerus mordax TaxID=8014 RepID=UPI00350EE254
MKVNKSASGPQQRSRNPAKQQCNNKWFKRSRVITPDSPSTSPGAAMAKLEQQISAKASIAANKKTGLKRLKKKAKAVCSKQVKNHAGERTHFHPLTNGRTGLKPDSDSEDSQDWSSFAQSVLQNGVEAANGQEAAGSARVASGELNEETFHYCAERDHAHNRTVLVMQPGQTLCFRGKCLLTCLYGRVEVLGFTIEEGQQSYPLFSPSSHCPLTITALGDCSNPNKNTKEGRLEAKATVRKYLSLEPRKRLLSEVDSGSCVILLEPLDTPLTRFLQSLPELSELFELSAKDLQDMSAMLDTPLNGTGVVPLRSTTESLVMSRSYRDSLNTLITACSEELDGCPVILVCGPQNTGKSTFNRHLINTLLNHTASVEYLECDLGQTELTPPGCLSLSTIREPLLGPPFTHQCIPDHMIFYGQSNCQTDLDRYLESIKSLWRSYTRDSPIIINTMGWVKGFGLQLLVDMIRFFSVSHVVQLGYGSNTQCPALTPDVLRSLHGWQTHPPAQSALGEDPGSSCALRSYTHLPVLSTYEGAGKAGKSRYQRSNELRELCLLGYLSKLQSPDPGPVLPIHCLTPFQVPHSAVALGVTHCEVAPKHILYAANASLVGLCCLGERVAGKGGPVLLSQTPVCPCVGLGVLRGVDMARGLYFIITPVAPSVLRQVNCLLLGGVSLPHALFKDQPGIEGEAPYLTTDYSFELAGAGKLHVYKGLTRPGHTQFPSNAK